jgi:hypothetical protein
MGGLPAVFKGFELVESCALIGCNGFLVGVGIDALDEGTL